MKRGATSGMFNILQGDALAVLLAQPERSFDACLCDPPYGLSFMGKEWDHGVPSAEMWAAVHRVLKPGAMLLAFGGTRTHHRLMSAIEDAGFEIRDCMMWLYGSGFPKSLDVSKAIDKAAGAERRYVRENPNARPNQDGKRVWCGDKAGKEQSHPPITEPSTADAVRFTGYGTALKPAWEPIIVAMKPLDGTFAQNALKWGVAGLNIEAGRIETRDSLNGGAYAETTQKSGKSQSMAGGLLRSAIGREFEQPAGRWPANVLLDPESAAMLDEQSGILSSGFMAAGTPRNNRMGYNGAMPPNTAAADTYGDSGGASRFFYIAKADSNERHAAGKNTHPCVKPVDLCAYLARLILPPSGRARRIVVPFSGSGSEIMGALRAGWDEAVGIEQDPQWCGVARKRISFDAPLLNTEDAERDGAIRRCDQEIAALDALPEDIPAKAVDLAMARNDWEHEKRLIRGER